MKIYYLLKDALEILLKRCRQLAYKILIF